MKLSSALRFGPGQTTFSGRDPETNTVPDGPKSSHCHEIVQEPTTDFCLASKIKETKHTSARDLNAVRVLDKGKSIMAKDKKKKENQRASKIGGARRCIQMHTLFHLALHMALPNQCLSCLQKQHNHHDRYDCRICQMRSSQVILQNQNHTPLQQHKPILVLFLSLCLISSWNTRFHNVLACCISTITLEFPFWHYLVCFFVVFVWTLIPLVSIFATVLANNSIAQIFICIQCLLFFFIFGT